MRIRAVGIPAFMLAIVLTGCGGGGPAGASNADPVGAAKLAVSYIEQKKFDQLGDVFCAAQAAQMAATLNPAAGAGSAAGVDAKKLLDGMTIKVENLQVTEVSRSADKAVVSMKGRITITIDPAAAKEIVKAALAAQGVANAPDSMVDPIVQGLVGQFAQGDDINEASVEVVNEGGKWKVCSDFTS